MRAFTLRIVCLMILILAWTASPARAHENSAQDNGDVPRFEPGDCPMEVPEGETVECGYLVVLEHHDNPDGGTLRLAVAILPSRSANPEPDPVLYLEGGPGGSALEGMELWIASPLRSRRDFILLEQRGTYYSEPNLYCVEYDEATSEHLDDLLTNDEWLEIGNEASQKCIDRLTGEGVDLTAYNSVESAADVADLRTALGYDEINLYGISYGTYLAQYVMQYQPEGIRSVILDSTVPVAAPFYEQQPAGFQRAFDTLFAACENDPSCSAAFPDLEEDFFAFVERADAEPITIRIRDPYSGRAVRSPMRGDDVIGMVFVALYDSTIIPFLPLMMDEMAHGDTRMLATFTELYLKGMAEAKFSVGMQLAFDCQDEISDNDYERALEAAEAFPDMAQVDDIESLFAVCELWGDAPPEPLQDAPVTSEIPTLVMAGSFDPVTPPQGGQDVADALPNGQYIEFPSLSHGTTTEACAGRIAAAFVDNPDGALSTGCMADIPDPVFITELTPLRKNVPLLESFLVDFNLVNAVVLGSLVLFALAGLVIWPIVRIVHRIMRSPEAPSLLVQLAALLAWLISGWNLLFLALFVVAGFSALSDLSTQTLIVFGLPQWAALVMLMPWFSLLALIPLVVLNVPIWREKFWRLFGRLFYLLLTATAIGFVGWLAYWQMIGWPF
jgi:pimeloyl-ACP methyl ester carboxylesterase